MNSTILFAIIIVFAYIIQIILGMNQLKNFNATYSMLRKKGKVAIGRRSGKIKSGTIVMFAINDNGLILDAQKMQGVTVIAKFKPLHDYIGEDIHYLDYYNPLVRKENKLLQVAIEDARELYLRMGTGTYEGISKYGSAFDVNINLKDIFSRVKLQFKK